jgi:diacylglycerol O-acyltransferase / wax synthase
VTGERPIGPVDRMWLTMDRPNNLMVIDAVMWLDAPIEHGRLTGLLRRRLLDRYPVFGQRPEPARLPGAMPRWQDDPDFSLRHHLRHTRLPRPGDETALRRYVDAQLSRPFDRHHPLWEMHLIDGYGDGAAVLARMHHALADGIALAQVLLSLTDADPDADLKPPADLDAAPAANPGHADRVGQVLALARHVGPGLVAETLTKAWQTAVVADKLTLRSNPPNRLSGHPGIAKRAVWSTPRPLQRVKALRALTGATVNDVLIAAVSAGIADYLTERGDTPVDLTTMVPVNLRPPGVPLPAELGNRFALVLLELASGTWPPLERLAETKRRMDAIKHSPEAIITFGLINAIGRTTPTTERLLVNFFSSKAFGVTTNVAGPTTERFLAGSRVDGVLGWVPGSGNHGVGISIVTYNGAVRLGFKVDALTVPDPDRLVAAVEASLDELLRIAETV